MIIASTFRHYSFNNSDLESDEIINRKVYPQVPPKVEYSLTELGMSLKPVIDTLASRGTNLKTTLNALNLRTLQFTNT